ncbi:MAG: RNA polymerase sigma factor [Clostridiales bacterium]|nr:RNA polymerase sigma factor [Clostridiales bacterium]
MDKDQMQLYYEAYADMIYRLGFTYMKNGNDAEDVVQETFLRFVRQTPDFANEEHVKAWLIVTASNYCKSMLRHWWNRRAKMGEIEDKPDDSYDHDAVLDAVLELPDKYKTTIFLYYYEGYTSKEIAQILHKQRCLWYQEPPML